MPRSTPSCLILALAALACASPALAHPHVWVTSKAQIVFAPDGKVTAIRHAWTFDAAYSTYVTQGLDKNGDGTLTPDELQDLAKENAESLVEFDYFTFLKANGAKPAFAAPRDYGMTVDNGQVTLAFVLPLKAPARADRGRCLGSAPMLRTAGRRGRFSLRSVPPSSLAGGGGGVGPTARSSRS